MHISETGRDPISPSSTSSRPGDQAAWVNSRIRVSPSPQHEGVGGEHLPDPLCSEYRACECGGIQPWDWQWHNPPLPSPHHHHTSTRQDSRHPPPKSLAACHPPVLARLPCRGRDRGASTATPMRRVKGQGSLGSRLAEMFYQNHYKIQRRPAGQACFKNPPASTLRS